MRPLVSVAVISYNHDKFIFDTLDSVLKQKTNFEFEIVIGDDGSSDKTQDILTQIQNKYPDKIKLILRKKNISAIYNLLDVYKNCKGRYISHLDGDDLMLPGKLRKQVEYFKNHASVSLVHHRCRAFDDQTKETMYRKKNTNKNSFDSVKHLVKQGNFIVHSSKMIDTLKFNRKEFIPSKFARGQDYYFNIVCVNNYNIGYIDQVLGEYRIHADGISQQPIENQWRFFFGELRAVRKAKEYEVLDKVYLFGLSRIYLKYADKYLLAGRFKTFEKLIEKSWLKKKISVRQGIIYIFKKYPAFILSLKKIFG